MLEYLAAISLGHEHIIAGMSFALPDFVSERGRSSHSCFVCIFTFIELNLLCDYLMIFADCRPIIDAVVDFDDAWHIISSIGWTFRLILT